MIDYREAITLEEFRQKFCNKCYWDKCGNCDIEIVGIHNCVHAWIDKFSYKIKEEKINED
jgi:hypothetical protein